MKKGVKLISILAVGALLAGCGGDATDVGGAQDMVTTPESVVTTDTTVKSDESETSDVEATEQVKIVEVPAFSSVNIPESEALSFVADLGAGWNLGNTFDATGSSKNEMDLETAWCGNITTKETIQAVADAGFKTIRIPVSWHNHVDDSYNISEQWLNRVQEVVDWAMEADLYVIINIHHDNEVGFVYPSYEHLEVSKQYVGAIWGQLAKRFADYDEKLIFETLNEPRMKDTVYEWYVSPATDTGKEAIDCVNQLNQVCVDAIRANGKGFNTSRYIMVPGYCAAADFALVDNFVIPTDNGATKENRILVSVHAYTPYNFALAGETDDSSVTEFSIAGKKGTKDIENFISKLYDKFVSKGIGVVIGEFGARAKSNNVESREEFAAFYVACARHYGISACWWDNNLFVGTGEKFGLLKRLDYTWTYPGIVGQLIYYSTDRDE